MTPCCLVSSSQMYTTGTSRQRLQIRSRPHPAAARFMFYSLFSVFVYLVHYIYVRLLVSYSSLLLM